MDAGAPQPDAREHDPETECIEHLCSDLEAQVRNGRRDAILAARWYVAVWVLGHLLRAFGATSALGNAWPLAAIPLLAWFGARYIQRHRRTEALFDHVLDGSGIGALTRLAGSADAATARVRGHAQKRLTGVLPLISHSDRLALGPHARLALRECLDAAGRPGNSDHYSPDFLCAAIGALVSVQDYDSLPEMDRLARFCDNDNVRRSATNAAGSLRPLAEKRGKVAGLLRPADPPASETLLRPASDASEAESERLLRPADTEAERPNDARG